MKSEFENEIDGAAIEEAEHKVTLANEATAAEVPKPIPAEVINFYQRYNLAMQGWVKAHGNTNFPITEVKQADGTLKLVWVNRDARKRIRKAKRSTSKK
jgi:hypothetical protein